MDLREKLKRIWYGVLYTDKNNRDHCIETNTPMFDTPEVHVKIVIPQESSLEELRLPKRIRVKRT